jgi:hypothetical protein
VFFSDGAVPGAIYYWSTFSPDGNLLLVSEKGILRLLETATGEPVGPNDGIVPLPAGKLANMPDWSGLGDKVAFAITEGRVGNSSVFASTSAATASITIVTASPTEPDAASAGPLRSATMASTTTETDSLTGRIRLVSSWSETLSNDSRLAKEGVSPPLCAGVIELRAEADLALPGVAAVPIIPACQAH